VERNRSATERLTERERTPSVAIVATRIQMPRDGTLAQASETQPDRIELVDASLRNTGAAGGTA
jgi:hypothetical protein